MFFLPLPLHKTMESLENVNECDEEHEVSLSSPDLSVYIFVYIICLRSFKL